MLDGNGTGQKNCLTIVYPIRSLGHIRTFVKYVLIFFLCSERTDISMKFGIRVRDNENTSNPDRGEQTLFHNQTYSDHTSNPKIASFAVQHCVLPPPSPSHNARI